MYNLYNYDNDLFFTCSIIEYIARDTHNTNRYIINKIGKDGIYKLYDLACVNHCLTPEQLVGEHISEYGITEGVFNIKADCNVNLPSESAVGSIYMALILDTLPIKVRTPGKPRENTEYKNKVIEQLFEIYNSWICMYIDNYNNLVFTGSTQFLYESYKEGKLLD